MTPRRAEDVDIVVPLSPAERAVLAEIVRIGGYTSRANAARSALWSLGKEFGIPMPRGVWDQRKPGPKGPRARRGPP